MKKLIYALFGCFITFGAFAADFADGGDFTTGETRTFALPVSYVPYFLQNRCPQISDENKDKMIAKYIRIIEQKGDAGLSINDMASICSAGGLNFAQCYDQIVSEIETDLKRHIIRNVCLKPVEGMGTQHCVDDVFVEKYKVDGTTKKSTKPYAQNVTVSPYTAFGFAWEYAKRQGHDVICSPIIDDDWINCVTLDNKHFYTFKFAGTNSKHDPFGVYGGVGVGVNGVARGICALFGVKYHGTPNQYMQPYCDMNCGVGTEAMTVIPKFAMSATPHSNICLLHVPDIAAGDMNLYPGYEHMSTNFQHTQNILNADLIKMLRKYIELQGITVDSFDCNYGAIHGHDEMDVVPFISGTQKVNNIMKMADIPLSVQPNVEVNVPVSRDNVLSCTLNGTPVDFMFNDLYEEKPIARNVSDDAVQCLFLQVDENETATFDGKYCRRIGEELCNKLREQTNGGARWDKGARACKLTDFSKYELAKDIIAADVGIRVTIALTMLTGGEVGVALFDAGVLVATEGVFAGLKRLNEAVISNMWVRQALKKAEKCPAHQCVGNEKLNECEIDVLGDVFAAQLSEDLNIDDKNAMDKIVESVQVCSDNDEDGMNQAGLFGKTRAKLSTKALIAINTVMGAVIIGSIVFLHKTPSKSLNRAFKQAKIPVVTSTEKVINRVGKQEKVIRLDVTEGLAETERPMVLDIVKKEQVSYVDYSKIKGYDNVDEFRSNLSKGVETFDKLPTDQQQTVVNTFREQIEGTKTTKGLNRYIDVSKKNDGLSDFGLSLSRAGEIVDDPDDQVFEFVVHVEHNARPTSKRWVGGPKVSGGIIGGEVITDIGFNVAAGTFRSGSGGDYGLASDDKGSDKPDQGNNGGGDNGSGNNGGGDKPESQPATEPDDSQNQGNNDGAGNVVPDPNLGEEGIVILGGE